MKDKAFRHSVSELKKLIRKQPVRIAQRLLREFGEGTEEMISINFPEMREKKMVMEAVREQRRTWEERNWNKGYVRSY